MQFLNWKFSDLSNSEYSRICLQNSSVGTRHNQEKILSSFREISKKYIFSDHFSKQETNVRRFLSGKFSDFSNSECSKKCLQNTSVGTRNNNGKILSSFQENPEMGVFSNSKWATRVPSTTIHPLYKKILVSKKVDPRGCFWNQKSYLGGRYKTERDQIGTP